MNFEQHKNIVIEKNKLKMTKTKNTELYDGNFLFAMKIVTIFSLKIISNVSNLKKKTSIVVKKAKINGEN